MEVRAYKLKTGELIFVNTEEEIQLLSYIYLNEQCEYLFTINNEQNIYSIIANLFTKISSRRINNEVELEQAFLFFKNIPVKYQELLKNYMNIVELREMYYNETIKIQSELLKMLEELRDL